MTERLTVRKTGRNLTASIGEVAILGKVPTAPSMPGTGSNLRAMPLALAAAFEAIKPPIMLSAHKKKWAAERVKGSEMTGTLTLSSASEAFKGVNASVAADRDIPSAKIR
jgi:hypothetical protein